MHQATDRWTDTLEFMYSQSRGRKDIFNAVARTKLKFLTYLDEMKLLTINLERGRSAIVWLQTSIWYEVKAFEQSQRLELRTCSEKWTKSCTGDRLCWQLRNLYTNLTIVVRWYCLQSHRWEIYFRFSWSINISQNNAKFIMLILEFYSDGNIIMQIFFSCNPMSSHTHS